MNWRLIPRRFGDLIALECVSFRTPGCGPGFSLAKWTAILLDRRELNFLGHRFCYEDRFGPVFFPAYIREVQTALEACLPKKKPTRVLDIGANVGAWAKSLLSLFPECSVFSFEPNPEPFRCLGENRQNSGCTTWKSFNYGVLATETTCDFFFVPGKSAQGSIYRENAGLHLLGGGEPVRAVVTMRPLTHDFLDSQCGGSHFDFVKIDVEGAEHSVIEGLEHISWHGMYVELSTNRAGKSSVEDFVALVQRLWPHSQLARCDIAQTTSELYFVRTFGSAD